MHPYPGSEGEVETCKYGLRLVARGSHAATPLGASRRLWQVVLIGGLLAAGWGEARARQDAPGADPSIAGRPTVRGVRLDDGDHVELDGVLDEPAWRRATPATEFRQQEPREGAAPSERTEVYVLYDAAVLYLGAMLYDSDPQGILAYQRQRDAGLGTDDRFMWILDTFLDGRTGYFFEINPAGLMGDGLLSTGARRVNKSWDGIWEARVARHERGWSAEIRIPFRTLNFNPDLDSWGINFQRTVRRKNEEMLWSGHRRNQGLFRAIHAGRLTGLEGLSQGMGLEAIPYALGAWRNQPELDDPTDFPTEIGVDFNYSVTPSLRAAVTINTDFAEVEVDERQVNLTRFPLFFPERRDFFLEGSSVFSFAERNGVNPYFSRRVGLFEGQSIPITYGARLGGQAGRYDLGFIQLRTGEGHILTDEEVPDTVAAEDFTVARVRRNIFEQSSIGAIYTRRSMGAIEGETAPPVQQTFGFDLDLFTFHFLRDKNLQFEAFLVWHTDPERDGLSSFGDLSARGVRLNYPNDIWRGHVSYREFGDGYDPAVGFVERNGFRRVQPTVAYAPRPALAAIRQLEFQVQFEYLTSLDNILLTRSTDVTLLGVEFESGDRLSFGVQQLFERLGEEFEIHPQIILPIGGYNTLEWVADGRSAGRRAVSGDVEVARGGFWSGTRTRLELGLTVKPRPGISVRTEFEKNDVDLEEGAFSAHLVRLIGEWHMSPWASFTNNLQYDDVSEVLGLQARLRWILRPGSDLFLVYTQNWQNTGSDLSGFHLQSLSRRAATKINYTHRF